MCRARFYGKKNTIVKTLCEDFIQSPQETRSQFQPKKWQKVSSSEFSSEVCLIKGKITETHRKYIDHFQFSLMS